MFVIEDFICVILKFIIGVKKNEPNQFLIYLMSVNEKNG